MKQALPSGAKGHFEENVQRAVLYLPVLVAAVILLAAAFVIVGIVLYRADALMIVPSTSIPFVMVDPSAYLPQFISLIPLPTDGNLPVPRV